MLRALPLAAACLAAAACFSAPPMKDPLAGLPLPSAGTSWKELSAAVAVSENTKATFGLAADLAEKNEAWAAPKFAGIFPDMRAKLGELTGFLQSSFGRVVKVSAPEELARAGVDVGLIIDMHPTRIPKMTMEPATFTTKVIVVDGRDGRVLDTFTGEGATGRRGFRPVYKVMEEAIDQAWAKVRAQMLASESLAGLTSGAAKPAPAAAAPPAPAARAYSSDVDRPTYSLPEDERKFALVVGVERYGSLPAADFAERDAEAVRRHLLALGYPERQVVLLRGEQATRGGIEKYVEQWLPNNVREDSQVLFYFSGHGAPDPASGQAYLVPWDGDPKYLATTGYPLKRLYDRLSGLKVERRLVTLDACFSGAGGRSVLAKGTRPLVLKVDEGAEKLGQVVVLAAAGPDEVTGTDEAQGHGLFTYHLLKAIADSRGRGAVRDVFDALTRRVQDGARRENREQTPRLIDPAAGAAGASF